MNINIFRYISGLTVLLAHIVSIAIIFRSNRFDDVHERIETIFFISPILAVYFGVFINFVVSSNHNLTKTDQNKEHISIINASVMYAIILLFCVTIVYFVVDFNSFYAFEVSELQLRLGAVETLFGVTIGLIFDRLFGLRPESKSLGAKL